MKAAICYAPQKPLEIAEVDQQGPQAGEVRVRVKATGICHSDWHVINGDWTLPLPMVPGRDGDPDPHGDALAPGGAPGLRGADGRGRGDPRGQRGDGRVGARDRLR